jgi:hypothetical protein
VARTIERCVDLVLVRPGGAQAGVVDDLEPPHVRTALQQSDHSTSPETFWFHWRQRPKPLLSKLAVATDISLSS